MWLEVGDETIESEVIENVVPILGLSK